MRTRLPAGTRKRCGAPMRRAAGTRNRPGERTGCGASATGAGARRAPGRLARCGRERRQEVQGITIGVLVAGLADSEMQMGHGSGPGPGRANRTEPVPGGDRRALAHRDRGQVQVGGVEAPVGAAHRDGDPGAAERPGEPHLATDRGHDGGALGSRDVNTPVLTRRIGVGAVVKGGDDLAAQRPLPAGDRGRRRNGREAKPHEGDEKGTGGHRANLGRLRGRVGTREAICDTPSPVCHEAGNTVTR